MFHLFSEVESSCPSEEDGYFPELFRWQIDELQVSAAVTSKGGKASKCARAQVCYPGQRVRRGQWLDRANRNIS